MTYQIDLRLESNFIHAQVDGIESLENIKAYWCDIAKACLKHKCKKVLVEDYLEGMVSIIDMKSFTNSFAKETSVPHGSKIALVMPAGQLEELIFSEVVARNWNGVILRGFIDADLEKAKV
jgi:hypothetical protein